MSEQTKATAGVDAGADNATAESTGGSNSEPAKAESGTAKTYSQSELDSAIGKAVSTALNNFQNDKLPAILKDRQTEWERLEKLSAEERARTELEREREQLEKERGQYQREKLELETMKELGKRQLPGEFAAFLTGADAERTNENLAAFDKAFRAAIQKGVDERLAGPEPPKAGSKTTPSKTDGTIAGKLTTLFK